MSYCRFQNTLADLEDCNDALYEINPQDLSNQERRAALEMKELCELFLEDHCDKLEQLQQLQDES
jgi:hypothetical protein